MDWRLIAAISGAAGSFFFVAGGAYVLFTHHLAPRRTAPAPMLLSEYRFPVTTPSPLLSAEPAIPRPLGPASDPPAQSASENLPAQSPFAPQGSAAPPYPPPLAAEGQAGAATTGETVDSWRIGTSAPAVNALRHGRHGAGPSQAGVEKSSAVPEPHTALRYRGVLTSAEIVRVKTRLRLTPDQERAWPPVEAALAEMGRQQIALIRRGQEPRISSSDWSPGRLYAAAGPLLQTLRADQMEAVRRLCRSLGFESVASMI